MAKYFNTEQFPSFRFVMGPNFMTQAVYMIVLPIFFIVYSIIYNPFDIQQYYENAPMGFGFSIVIITCIILLCLGATRTAFAFIIKKVDFTRWHYLAWCLGELFIISAFTALYTILIKNTEDNYLTVLKTCTQFIYLVLVHPYIFILLVRTIMSRNEQIAILESPKDSNLVKFYDEHKRLKMTIAASSILFIKSDFNYVIIHYLDSGRPKEYQLRCSMKSIENNPDIKSLVRCHRSYFVNPEHVSVLRKDKEGFITAELNVPDLEPVPVSKSYYKSVASLL